MNDFLNILLYSTMSSMIFLPVVFPGKIYCRTIFLFS